MQYKKKGCSGNSLNMGNMIIPSGSENAIRISAFDLSIQDLSERRKRRLTFHTLQAACNYFGLNSRTAMETAIKNKTRLQKDKKYFAVRREREEFDNDLK